MSKKAIIFGVTGQDGSYLAKFLLKKNYVVYGIKRRTSSENLERIEDIIDKKKFKLKFGDVTDSLNITGLLKKIRPDEIYNFAAQSHVAISFELPEYTAESSGVGTLKILEAIRQNNLQKKTKFYQSGTSELYGKNATIPQNEKTLFHPASPYSVAKLFAHWATTNYRESFGIFACNGICFNHESPYRGENFVTRKIVRGLVKIKKKLQKKLVLGNLYAKRDWGHAEDFVKGMWLMLQQKVSDDYVLATGKQYTVKKFIEITAKHLKLRVIWNGKGIKEVGYINGVPRIFCDKKYFRPNEVDNLLGDFSKAKKKLGWKPEKNINDLVLEMIEHENKLIS